MSRSSRNPPPSRRVWLALAAVSALLMAILAVWMFIVAIHTLRQGGLNPPSKAVPAEAPAPSGAAEAPGAACNVQRSAPLAFRDVQARDTLAVRIAGPSCAQARVTISVQDAHGTELYRYDAPFPPHLTAEQAQKPLPQAAQDFAQAVIANAGIAGTTDALPPWPDAVAYYAGHHDAIKIDEATYEALRRVRRPIFWHATGRETWRSVVYDPRTRKGRVILVGGD